MAQPQLKKKAKALPPDDPAMAPNAADAAAVDPAMAEPQAKDYGDEPYGAQVLRRMHEDHGHLMKDYDEMHRMCENEHVKKLMMKDLQHKAAHMDEIESAFGKHYKDLPPLEPHDDPLEEEESKSEPEPGEEIEEEPEEVEEETKDMDTPDDPASGEPDEDRGEEEPTGEEAFGASTKSLRRRYGGRPLAKRGKEMIPPSDLRPGKSLSRKGKSLNRYGKAMDEPLGDAEKADVGEASQFLKDLSQEGSEFEEEHRFKSYHYHKTLEGIGQVKGMAGDEYDDGDPEDQIAGMGAKALSPERQRQIDKDAVENAKLVIKYNPNDAPTATAWGTAAMDFGYSGEEAARFVATSQDAWRKFGGKSLRPGPDTQPGQRVWCENYEENGVIQPAGPNDVGVRSGQLKIKLDSGEVIWEQMSEVSKGKSMTDGDPIEDELESEAAGDKSMHAGRKACMAASKFFKDLAGERAFGDPHRQEAAEQAKALDDAVGAGGGGEKPEQEYPGVMMEGEEEPPHEPGEMGEKGRKGLAAAAARQGKQLSALQKSLERLNALVAPKN